jgi:integrase
MGENDPGGPVDTGTENHRGTGAHDPNWRKLPRKRNHMRDSVERYLKSGHFTGKTKGYQDQIRFYMSQAEKELKALGLPTHPKDLDANHLSALWSRPKYKSDHKRWMIFVRLRGLLEFLGNHSMNELTLDLTAPEALSRPAYSPAEMKLMKEAANDPYEKWLLHIELDYGQRRITALRSQVDDFDLLNGTALLRIKGKGGTKTMTKPMHEDTPALLEAVLQRREAVIAQCVKLGYDTKTDKVPPELLIHAVYDCPVVYRDTGLDSMLSRICENAGVKYRGHHATRRGIGKAIYDLRKDLVQAQQFLGHRDPKTTLIYLGCGDDRQKDAYKAVAEILG